MATNSKYLRMVFSTSTGGKKTISIRQPKSNLTLDRVEGIANNMISTGVFNAKNSAGIRDNLMGFADTYFEETTITNLT